MRLYELEKACWDYGMPSVILFEGWDGSGKGTAISALTQRLDPRGFRLHSTQAPRTFEQQYPWLWRFWLKGSQGRGEMLIFDHSWYGRMLDERIDLKLREEEWRRAAATFSISSELPRRRWREHSKIFLSHQARRNRRSASRQWKPIRWNLGA